MIGKQPAHYHIWILEGTAPAFIREEGQLYEGGPIWRIEQISPSFPPDSRRKRGEKSTGSPCESSCFPDDLQRIFVISECNQLRVSVVIGVGPLKELNLCDGLRTNPRARL
jgi:hypothetical protein